MAQRQVSRENIGKLKAAWGKKHTYLGIDLDFSKPGEVSLSMINYVKEMLEAFPDQGEINKKATTPAAPHLFQVRDTKKLDKDKAKIFTTLLLRVYFYVPGPVQIFSQQLLF